MLESGIKVLDLFAPLVQGGTIGLLARANMGQLVLVQELFHRFGKQGFVTVFWSPFHAKDFCDEKQHKGIRLVMKHAQFTTTTLDKTYRLIESKINDKDIILATNRQTIRSGDLSSLKERLKCVSSKPLTFVLVDVSGDSVDEDEPFGPLDTLIHFDSSLATRKLYPAVDPITSTSTLSEKNLLQLEHLSIQQHARKFLLRFRELRTLLTSKGIEHLSNEERMTYHRGELLEAFLSQPFYVAEPWSNHPGESVSLNDVLNETQKIIGGQYDHHSVEGFMYKGKLTF